MRQFFRKIYYRLKGYKIGKHVHLGRGTQIHGRQVCIEDRCYLGDGVYISSPNIHIGYNSIIYDHTQVHTKDKINIGYRSKISRNCIMKAHSISIGHDFWCNENVEIGGGGWQSNDALLLVGDFVHIGKGTHLNVCKPIQIGDCCGIGMECLLFTHSFGNGQSVLKGYKLIENSIIIGTAVSIFTRVILSPGSVVEDGALIAAGSFVSGTIQSNSLYAGAPARFKRAVVPLSNKEQLDIIKGLLPHGQELPFGYLHNYSIDTSIVVVPCLNEQVLRNINKDDSHKNHCIICLRGEIDNDSYTIINLEKQQIKGKTTEVSEMLRDKFRRIGVILYPCGYVPSLLNGKELLRRKIEL